MESQAFPSFVCLKRVVEFEFEFSQQPGDNPAERRQAVLHCERQCEEFTPWLQGFTPKEHQEMLQEAARLAYQERREEADRQWRTEQAKQADDRHDAQMQQLAKQSRQMTAYLILTAIAVGAAIASAVAAWYVLAK